MIIHTVVNDLSSFCGAPSFSLLKKVPASILGKDDIIYGVDFDFYTPNTKPDSIESKVTIKAVQSGKIYFQNTECVCNIFRIQTVFAILNI